MQDMKFSIFLILLVDANSALNLDNPASLFIATEVPSSKDAPVIDYKNINLLKKYISDNGKIISSKITSVSFGKQKKLTKEIKKAKILGLI